MNTEGEPPKKSYEYTRMWGIALKADAVERFVLGSVQALHLKAWVIFDHLTENLLPVQEIGMAKDSFHTP